MDKTKLWKRFSKWVRESASDVNGYCNCCTCGAPNHWKNMDAGHFIPRIYPAVFFDELNVHPQCRHCNRLGDGATQSYEFYLEITYGPGTVDRLWQKARSNKVVDLFEVDKKLKEYGY